MELHRNSPWKSRLIRSVREATKRMKPIREKRRELIGEYLSGQLDNQMSTYLGIPLTQGRRPYNMLHQGVSTIVPHLTGAEPVARFVPKRVGMQPAAYLMSEALMYLNRQQRMLQKYRRCVMDAMFGPGILYTHIDLSGRDPDEDVKFDPMEVFTQNVSPDDYLIDAVCRHRDERRFEGHVVRADIESLQEHDIFPEEFIRAMPDFRERMEDRDTMAGDTRPGDIMDEHADEYATSGYYTQLYLPREGLIVYLPGFKDEHFVESMPCMVQDYYGPDDGPYSVLGFDWAPESPLPIAPVGIWLDMHLAVNLMMGKIINNSKVMKNLILVRTELKEEAERIRSAPDDGVVPTEDPDGVKTIQVGGVTSNATELVNLFQRVSSAVQGNSDFMGGIQSKAKTATEAQLLAGAGNVRLNDMQGMVEGVVRDSCNIRAWHIWPGNNPDVELPLHKMVQGVMLFMPFNAEVVRGDYMDMHFDIEVGSMLKKDERQETVDKMDHGQLILQALEMEQITGGRFNAEAFVRITGRNVWRPGELEQIFQTDDTMLNQILGMSPVGEAADAGRTRIGQVADRPGRPGRPGMKGRLQTGSNSRFYDSGQQAEARADAAMSQY